MPENDVIDLYLSHPTKCLRKDISGAQTITTKKLLPWRTGSLNKWVGDSSDCTKGYAPAHITNCQKQLAIK
jgi:hypothetical protein